MMKKILLLGGSGGLSGCLARLVTERGFEVWAVTRGQRPLPSGVHPICADREQEEELTEKLRGLGIKWDVVFDCICMNARHAAWDMEVLPEFTGHLCQRVYTMEKLRTAGVLIPSTSLEKGLGYSIFPPSSSCTP